MSKRKIRIDDVILKEHNLAEPCLVQFTNGTLKEKSRERLSASLYRSVPGGDNPTSIKSILNISSPESNFVGKSQYSASKNSMKDQFFLGILDKNTAKMTLVEASAFLAAPNLQVDPPKTPAVPSSPLSKALQMDKMAEFGGKKARNYMRKREMFKVDFDAMSTVYENANVNAEPIDFGEEEQESTDFSHIVPPCNREAHLIEDVYSLSSIVTDEELMEYTDYAHDILENGIGDDETSLYSMLFAQTLATCKLRYEKDDEELVRATCANLYMDSLVFLLKLRGRNLDSGKLKKLCCPPTLLNKMLHEFTTKKGNVRVKTNELEDKLASYILVLAFLLNSNSLSLSTLLSSMGLEKTRLVKLVRVVGATIKHNEVALKLPLAKLPVVRNKLRRKR